MSISVTPRGGAVTSRGGWDIKTPFYQDDVCEWLGIEYRSLLPFNQGNQPDTSGFAWLALPSGTAISVLRNSPPNLMDPQWAGGAPNDGVTNCGPNLDAIIAATPSAQGQVHVYMPGGAGGYVFDNYQPTKRIIITGDGIGTLLLPGASGQIFNFASLFATTLERVAIAARPGGTTPAYDYAKPLIQFGSQNISPRVRNVFAKLTDTGTIFRFLNAYDSDTVVGCNFESGPYGVPIRIDATSGTNDTIGIRDCLNNGGAYFILMHDPTGALASVHIENCKSTGQGGGTSGGVLLDDIITADTPAPGTANPVVVVANGASWNVGNAIFIAGDFATDGGTAPALGSDWEVNRISAVAGNNLTLQNPLEFNHGTNGGAFKVMALRGGIHHTLPQGAQDVTVKHCHFEGLAWAGIAGNNILGVTYEANDGFSNRLLRITGFVNRLRLVQNKLFGRAAENVVIDIPSYGSATGVRGFLDWRQGNIAPSGTTAMSVTLLGVNNPAANFLDSAHQDAYNKAGTPTDADFICVPPVGRIVTDTTANKLWSRVAGVNTWKSVAIV